MLVGKAAKAEDDAPKFVAFGGGGARLDGKKTPPKGDDDKEGAAGAGSRPGVPIHSLSLVKLCLAAFIWRGAGVVPVVLKLEYCLSSDPVLWMLLGSCIHRVFVRISQRRSPRPEGLVVRLVPWLLCPCPITHQGDFIVFPT